MTAPADAEAARDLRNKVARAEHLWEQRLDPEALAEAMAVWRDQAAHDPNDLQARASLMRAYLFAAEGPLAMGDYLQSRLSTLAEAMALGEEALTLGCQALKVQHRDGLARLHALPGLCGATSAQWVLWYAAALTDFAMAADVSVLLTWQKPIVALWQDLIARGDPSGDAHAYLGAFYARAPAFAGGNLPLAKTYLEQAMAARQDLWRTRVWYAEYVLVPLGMRDASLQTLRPIAEADPPSQGDARPEQHLAQLRARQLLERLDELL